MKNEKREKRGVMTGTVHEGALMDVLQQIVSEGVKLHRVCGGSWKCDNHFLTFAED